MSNENLEKLNQIISENFAEEVLLTITEDNVESNQEQESPVTYITFNELKSKFTPDTKITDILQIKKYLPIVYKRVLVDNIIASAKDYTDNGMVKIDYINLEIFRLVHLIEAYTNYAFASDTMIEEVDYIMENKIFDLIREEIGNKELFNVYDSLNMESEQMMKIDNSIESVINNHLYLFQDKIDLLITKIPDFKEDTVNKWVKSLSKTLKNIDPKQFSMVSDLANFAKGTGK